MVVNNALAATTGSADLGGAFSPERLSYAGQMTLLGMLMVFLVLAILWGILTLFKVFFVKTKAEPKKQEEKHIEKTPEAEVEATEQHSDAELVAIITAAITAYRASEGQSESYADGFRVVSFNRVGGGRSWNSK